MISVFKEGDNSIWIPVANGKEGSTARSFLPFNKVSGTYRHGYKAAPLTSGYFKALSDIQQAFNTNEHRFFYVNGGKKKERQYKARWRHDNIKSSPLLGPTMGWVRVEVDQLQTLTDRDLENALRATGTSSAIFLPQGAKPVLCGTAKLLEQESARLYHAPVHGTPSGQAVPARQQLTTAQFVRDAAVVAYVLKEADGKCESCLNPAPFIKANGLPYLEVHHVKHLAYGGSDTVSNAVAVCPNCHRKFHHSAEASQLVNDIYSRVGRLERE